MQKGCVCVGVWNGKGEQKRPHTNAPDDVSLEFWPKQSWPRVRELEGWSAAASFGIKRN